MRVTTWALKSRIGMSALAAIVILSALLLVTRTGDAEHRVDITRLTHLGRALHAVYSPHNRSLLAFSARGGQEVRGGVYLADKDEEKAGP